MSELHDEQNKPSTGLVKGKRAEENSGPNLVLIYSLLALALLAAIVCAAAIVWPFYVRR
jgi:hypothetical protein